MFQGSYINIQTAPELQRQLQTLCDFKRHRAKSDSLFDTGGSRPAKTDRDNPSKIGYARHAG